MSHYPALSAEQCERQTTMWTGSVTVSSATGSSDIGLAVEAPRLGETLRVVGVSADGIDTAGFAHQVDVAVGATPAVAGATVTGGPVSIAYNAAPAVTVTGLSLVVDRCVTVGAAAGTNVVGSPPGTTALPLTGGVGVPMLMVATGLVAAGMLLGSTCRRRGRPRSH